MIQLSGKTSLTYLVVAGASIAFLLLFVLGFRLVGRCVPEKPTHEQFQMTPHRNPIYNKFLSYHVEMDNLKIHTDRVLGSGHFGVVCCVFL